MSKYDKELALMLGRRSIRNYLQKSIPEDVVNALLEAAMAAPSARAADPWRFVVVRSRKTLSELAGGLPNGAMIAGAPLGITVCGELEAANGRELSYLLQDCSAAIQNLLLAAHALGCGACWLGVHPRADRMAHVARVHALAEGIVPVCCIAIGYPQETKPPRTRYTSSYVHQERW